MKTLLVFLLLSLGSMIQLRGEATMVLFNDDYCKANSSMRIILKKQRPPQGPATRSLFIPATVYLDNKDLSVNFNDFFGKVLIRVISVNYTVYETRHE